MAFGKKELVEALSVKTGQSKKDTQEFLDSLGDVVKDALYIGAEVSFPGLGKLATKQTAARTGRNPRTGDAVEIPARRTVKFTASKVLKDAIAD